MLFSQLHSVKGGERAPLSAQQKVDGTTMIGLPPPALKRTRAAEHWADNGSSSPIPDARRAPLSLTLQAIRDSWRVSSPAASETDDVGANNRLWTVLPEMNDLVGLVGAFLTAKDVARMSMVSREWHAAATHMTQYIRILDSEGLEQHAFLPDHPMDMIRLERLDLVTYGVPIPTRHSSHACDVDAGISSTPPRPSSQSRGLSSSQDSYASTGSVAGGLSRRNAWLIALTKSRVMSQPSCCARLRALALGPLVPKKIVVSLLRGATGLTTLKMRDCENTTDDVSRCRSSACVRE